MLEKAKTHGQAERNSVPALRLFEGFVLLCGLLLFGYALVVGFSGENGSVPESEPVMATEVQDKDYSRFTHSNQFHSRLPCLVCHRRDDNSSRIGFPGKINHLPCAGCHALQLADQSSPICTICHTNPQTGAMKRFPPLRSFGARFNHSRHTRVNCVTCHKSQGRGIAQSIPSGPSAHLTCFQCHTAKAATSMSSCSVCHQPGRLVRTSESAKAFRVGFSHAKHAGSRNMRCNTCHTIKAGAARGRQVTLPLASMHFASQQSQSCGGCHNGKRAFGPDDFVNCKRCHQNNTFKF
jgi:c(7)-type cytochrome triheme protein